MGAIPPLFEAPRTYLVLAVTFWGALQTALSFVPPTPLFERPGFQDAVTHAATTFRQAPGRSFAVVWPPEQAAALSELPADIRAADAVPSESAARRQYTRIIVLGPAGFDDPPETRGATVGERAEFGDVDVATYTYPDVDRALFDLRSQLPQAEVRMEAPGGVIIPCDEGRSDGGWQCRGRPPWNYVGPTSLRVDGSDWPCVWAHPVQEHALVIDLGSQTLGDRIEVEAALSDGAAATPGGASVRLSLEVPGVGKRMLTRTNKSGVATLALDTAGEVAPVRLRIQTAKDGRRHMGVNLRIVKRGAQ